MQANNRLDFIFNIDDEHINMMTRARSEFIKMDNDLVLLGSQLSSGRPGVQRCISLARTNIETALQYTIKALCLMGEIDQQGE